MTDYVNCVVVNGLSSQEAEELIASIRQKNGVVAGYSVTATVKRKKVWIKGCHFLASSMQRFIEEVTGKTFVPQKKKNKRILV